jgi:hypothetical protein
LECGVTDVKIVKENGPPAEEKASPSSGLFGFAGTTLFQPGQKLFDPNAVPIPFDPKAKDAKPDKPA